MKKTFLVISIILIALVCVWKFNSKEVVIQEVNNPYVSYLNASANDIVVTSPTEGGLVSSPLMITGTARGTWYFEASFPLVLLDEKNMQIGTGHAEAKGEWMTENFVPFTATLIFSKPTTQKGTLVLKNDNPSGEAIRDKEIRIPVIFGKE